MAPPAAPRPPRTSGLLPWGRQVYDVCGNDYRLYASPLIKFQKACVQLVAGTLYRLAGEPCPRRRTLVVVQT